MEIESFCVSGDDPRSDLHHPFRVGEFVVCTDGHRLIAAPTDDDTLPRNKRIAGAVLGIIAEASADDGFLPMPSIDLPDKVQCGACGGAGTVTVTECPECEGDGFVDAETDYSIYYDLECKSCEGIGKRIEQGYGSKCQRCRGTGTVYPQGSIGVLGVRLRPAYVESILGLPDLMVNPLSRDKLYFRSGDFRGCIMGMTR